MELRIVSPGSVIAKSNVEKVLLPGTKGAFMVLRNHAPIISLLEKGKIAYEVNGTAAALEIAHGLVEVKHNIVNVLVEY